MTKRRPLAPNNRQSYLKQFMSELGSTPAYIKAPKSKEKASVFAYARAGRQTSEGFGGGNRVSKR